MHECLNSIRTDAIESFGNPVPWCKCLSYALLVSREPTLDAYFEDWVRANACDEAHVRTALLDVRELCEVARPAATLSRARCDSRALSASACHTPS